VTEQDSGPAFLQFVEQVINQKNVDAIDELATPDFVEHEALPGIPPGREGVKLLFRAVHEAFPDLHATIEDTVSEGDRAVVRMMWSGTQTGAFMGIAPTARHASWQVIDIVRVVDGKVAEHWGVMDQMSLMQQLGIIPAPEGAAT
jgi:predicted ester cyclase